MKRRLNLNSSVRLLGQSQHKGDPQSFLGIELSKVSDWWTRWTFWL
jgi:hypothetical protein